MLNFLPSYLLKFFVLAAHKILVIASNNITLLMIIGFLISFFNRSVVVVRSYPPKIIAITCILLTRFSFFSFVSLGLLGMGRVSAWRHARGVGSGE